MCSWWHGGRVVGNVPKMVVLGIGGCYGGAMWASMRGKTEDGVTLVLAMMWFGAGLTVLAMLAAAHRAVQVRPLVWPYTVHGVSVLAGWGLRWLLTPVAPLSGRARRYLFLRSWVGGHRAY